MKYRQQATECDEETQCDEGKLAVRGAKLAIYFALYRGSIAPTIMPTGCLPPSHTYAPRIIITLGVCLAITGVSERIRPLVHPYQLSLLVNAGGQRWLVNASGVVAAGKHFNLRS